ncbi:MULTISPECIES: ATP-binding protein [Clostridium]|uniref:histidine kinase n=2 Tax=Clostridium TaxID=1485 RepID=A0A151AKU4_9CLOT|nr:MULTISPECIES: ATP-binding protein [Clostridium]KYH28256.1 alkaline phosphatase synthesis sensor protein PhoR [Clostridium colicanis DSM 13634]PRR76535.1 Alkaline phosphatase synthesis sensor protein PhoR [Clostridium thermopalmarium DSM 5974]PVZ28352.1 HAMP domain-containing protein [Clostridium thermopalmarium DSM 5974]
MKKSIVLKLFVITVVFFTAFITIEMLFQSIFFQNFYIDRKTKNLKNNLENFEKSYVENIGNMEKNLSNIKDFEDDNNAKIVILESNGLLSYITDSQDKIKDSNRVSIIKKVVEEWTSNPRAFIDMQMKGETVTYIFNDPRYNIKNIVAIAPVSFNNIPVKVIFAVSSLQPVDEAVKVMKELYIYVYIAAVIIILILAFIYSKMIAKPLVELNNAALKMAKLDFTEKCEVTTEDEIGNLGKTLNFLAKNLSDALSSLKESNKQLRRDIEKEKELENMRKEFVAAVSHELKTPISLIEGYAEGIKDNIVQGEDRDYYLDVIIDEAKKMANMVSDMLELSKLESGNFKIEMNEFYLDMTINETIKRLEKIKGDKDTDRTFTIVSSVDKNLEVLGDEDRIEEVITNFLTNAIRHVKDKGNIYVRTLTKDDKIFVEIENEGEQIREEDMKKIWDRFYKIDKSRNRSLGGTGLGLSIVKHILQLHNSDFGVENTENGVKFYFSLYKKNAQNFSYM